MMHPNIGCMLYPLTTEPQNQRPGGQRIRLDSSLTAVSCFPSFWFLSNSYLPTHKFLTTSAATHAFCCQLKAILAAVFSVWAASGGRCLLVLEKRSDDGQTRDCGIAHFGGLNGDNKEVPQSLPCVPLPQSPLSPPSCTHSFVRNP